MRRAFLAALQKELIDADDTLIVFVDFSILHDRIRRLNKSFGQDSLHAVAIKTNPLIRVIGYLKEMGAGAEAASLPEIYLAHRAGMQNNRIVFDSPAKTSNEIEHIINYFPGIRLNADSLAELQRYTESGSRIRLGLRINPNVIADSPEYLTVGNTGSKFGEPLSNRREIISECIRNNDLDALHVHIGSQFLDLNPAICSIRSILDLAHEINATFGGKKITNIDIGGGFPVNYGEDPPYEIEKYADKLKKHCPEIFDGSFNLITEFGRYVHANAAWAMSKIEFIKSGNQLITHSGADMFLRECYCPGDWEHSKFILDRHGRIRDEQKQKYSVAGPLCFGGDYITKGAQLPQCKPGDWLVIEDVGANTFSLWSRHCSRPFPKVLAINEKGSPEEVSIIKERESINSIVKFWS